MMDGFDVDLIFKATIGNLTYQNHFEAFIFLIHHKIA